MTSEVNGHYSKRSVQIDLYNRKGGVYYSKQLQIFYNCLQYYA